MSGGGPMTQQCETAEQIWVPNNLVALLDSVLRAHVHFSRVDAIRIGKQVLFTSLKWQHSICSIFSEFIVALGTPATAVAVDELSGYSFFDGVELQLHRGRCVSRQWRKIFPDGDTFARIQETI